MHREWLVCLEIELDVVLGVVQHQPHEPVAVGKRQRTVKDGIAQGKAQVNRLWRAA